MSIIKPSDWSIFKEYLGKKTGLSIQYVDNYVDQYELYIIDGSFIIQCNLSITDPKNSDQIDFENNFKSKSNKNNLINTSAFSSSDGFRARCFGYKGLVNFGVVSNIDMSFPDEIWINGIEIYTDKSFFGDNVDLNIVHPSTGQILDDFGSSWNLDKEGKIRVILNYPAKIPAGLIIRIVYESLGAENVNVLVNLYRHKKF